MHSIQLVVSILFAFAAVNSKADEVDSFYARIPRVAWTPKNNFGTAYFLEKKLDFFDQQINEYCDNPVLTDTELEFLSDAQHFMISSTYVLNIFQPDYSLHTQKLNEIHKMVCRMVYSRSDTNNDGVLSEMEARRAKNTTLSWLMIIVSKIYVHVAPLKQVFKALTLIPFKTSSEVPIELSNIMENLGGGLEKLDFLIRGPLKMESK